MEYWPKLAVGAIVLREGKLLLVKRKYPPSPNYWSIPGGHVEPGEPIEKAVIRELEEETSLKASKVKLYAITEFIRLNKDLSIRYHYVILDYLILDAIGEVKANEESLDIGFFTLNEALKMDVTDTTRELINILMNDNLENPTNVKHILSVVYG